ncbi:MAG TPA: hypothetical protein VM345_01545 [Acidimicrobiales bacterium]|nr:hypothetical protein [Acidimicrobiales bacterium]
MAGFRWRRLSVASLAIAGSIVVGAAPESPAHATAESTVVGVGTGAPALGSSADVDPAAPISGIVATPTGNGYLQYGPDGRIYAFGDAPSAGDMSSTRLNQPVVAAALTPSGRGYWLIASDGGVFTFGDAEFHGSTGAMRLNQPIVAATATATGRGYWLVASDGGVFTFGDAEFHGSTGDRSLRSPVADMTPDPDGRGYWLVTSDGSVVAFEAQHLGSATGRGDGAPPAVGIAAARSGGYWISLSPVRPLPRGGTQLFPQQRVVGFYGRPGAPGLGVLGHTGPDDAAVRVAQQAAAYSGAGKPVLPAFEVIASLATTGPGPDGDYSAPIDGAVLDHWLAAARRHRMLMILDIQPGRADFLAEAKRYERWLSEPDVGLALDPEWSVRAPDRPGGGKIGSTDGETINRVGDYLAGLVRAHRLPQKLFVVHQFTRPMVENKHLVRARPELAVTFHADGFGSPGAKLSTYSFVRVTPPFANGFKLFYRQDTPVMSPQQVMELPPPPDLVTYQ